MKGSIKAKAILASILDAAGIHARLVRRRSMGRVAILMYHRILPKKLISKSVQAGMYVEPETLHLHICYLKRHFEIISLNDLVVQPDAVFAKSRERPACVLTFDDGWHDFFDHAYPILQAENTTATVFLPTSYIGTDQWFWTDRLGSILAEPRLNATSAGTVLDEPLLNEILTMHGSAENRLERAIGLLKPLRIEAIDPLIARLSEMLDMPGVPLGRAFLNWAEVQEMFESGLVTFGSHTARHPILTTLEDSEITRELKESMEVLVSWGVVSRDLVSFCYPNGGTSERIQRLVAEVGYKIAVTTQRGWNERSANPYALARIGVHQDITATQPMLASRMVASI